MNIDYKPLADTILYEQALKVIRETECQKQNPSEAIHRVNSAIYQEFWRRGKAKHYYDAHNQVMKSIGKHAAVLG